MRAFRGSDRRPDSGSPAERLWESRPERVKKAVSEGQTDRAVSRVGRDTRNLCLNERGPPCKPKYSSVTDSAKYCEGKVKRTPGGE